MVIVFLLNKEYYYILNLYLDCDKNENVVKILKIL